MKFTKMHGLGNDYVFVNAFEEGSLDWSDLAKRLSRPHFGIGSDGVIAILPSDTADFRMRIFNADGSEGEMCGNGIRCVGKYVYDHRLTTQKELKIETLAGIKKLRLQTDQMNRVQSVTVNMGKASISADLTLDLDGTPVTGTPINIGNPHFVIFVSDAENTPVTRLGPLIENHPAFVNRTNVEFIEIINRHEIRMRVWERGSGLTFACGTGATAGVAASIHKGLCESPVNVHLDGGDLTVSLTEETLFMTGPATHVFTGEIDNTI